MTSPTNEELLADPRLKVAIYFAMMDLIIRLQLPHVPLELIEQSAEATFLATSNAQGVERALEAIRHGRGG